MKSKRDIPAQVQPVVSEPHHCFRFQVPFDKPDEYIPYQMGRIILASGAIVRIIFCKEGMKLILPEVCKENGDIVCFENVGFDSR